MTVPSSGSPQAEAGEQDERESSTEAPLPSIEPEYASPEPMSENHGTTSQQQSDPRIPTKLPSRSTSTCRARTSARSTTPTRSNTTTGNARLPYLLSTIPHAFPQLPNRKIRSKTAPHRETTSSTKEYIFYGAAASSLAPTTETRTGGIPLT